MRHKENKYHDADEEGKILAPISRHAECVDNARHMKLNVNLKLVESYSVKKSAIYNVS